MSETITRQINFTNPTANNVGFLIQFFGNKHGFFTTILPQSVIHLTSHGSTIIKIQFYAKKIKKTKGNFFVIPTSFQQKTKYLSVLI